MCVQSVQRPRQEAVPPPSGCHNRVTWRVGPSTLPTAGRARRAVVCPSIASFVPAPSICPGVRRIFTRCTYDVYIYVHGCVHLCAQLGLAGTYVGDLHAPRWKFSGASRRDHSRSSTGFGGAAEAPCLELIDGTVMSEAGRSRGRMVEDHKELEELEARAVKAGMHTLGRG